VTHQPQAQPKGLQGATSQEQHLVSPSQPQRVTDGLAAGISRLARLSAEQLVVARHTCVALLAGAVVWEVAGRVLRFSFLPPFSNVLRAALQMIAGGQILGYLAASLASLGIGYGLAVVTGVTLGLLMGRYRTVEYVLEPYVNTFLASPKLVFVPILYAIFGVGRGVQVAVVFLSAFFIIVVNTRGGMRSVDGNWVEMARSFGASERQLFWKVLLPGALPVTMAGMRLGVGRAVKGMINGEMFIAVFGLGALLREYGSRFDSERVLAILLVVIGVALICSFAVGTIERRIIAWTEPGS
jgi:ABC-type nitrate/sulfonate/bicarbonate transport system permease component